MNHNKLKKLMQQLASYINNRLPKAAGCDHPRKFCLIVFSSDGKEKVQFISSIPMDDVYKQLNFMVEDYQKMDKSDFNGQTIVFNTHHHV